MGSFENRVIILRIFSVVCIVFGVVCISIQAGVLSMFKDGMVQLWYITGCGIWSGLSDVLAGSFGLAASFRPIKCLLVGTILMSILTKLLALAALAVILHMFFSVTDVFECQVLRTCLKASEQTWIDSVISLVVFIALGLLSVFSLMITACTILCCSSRDSDMIAVYQPNSTLDGSDNMVYFSSNRHRVTPLYY